MPGTSVNTSGPAPAQGNKSFGADRGSAFTPPDPEDPRPRDDPQHRPGVSMDTGPGGNPLTRPEL